MNEQVKHTRDEKIRRALKAFNEVLFIETSDTLETYWNPDEYLPAMSAAVSVSLPDPSEFRNAVTDVIETSEGIGTTEGRKKRDVAVNALWRLVYGDEGQP